MDISNNPEVIAKPQKEGGKKQITLERLRIALEKLHLARVKVTVTLIALGFTAYKFFYARIEDGKKPLLEFPNGRHIGIFLIAVGFLGLLLATVQHQKSLSRLKIKYKEMHYSLSLLLSYVILAFALGLLLEVAIRI